jgi:prepilin signal peptidase PulO-like enzyme (type II secretory pathway)
MKKDSPRKISMHITVKDFFVAFWRTILIWCIIILFIVIALHFNMDKTVIGGIVVVFGIITQAFTGLIGIISLIPFIGPLVAKILALPLFWLINALGYFVSILAIKKGFSKEVINYRILTIVLLVGIVIGFILGKII